MNKLIIFSDVDGTIYGDNKKISKFNKEQIKKFQNFGHEFVICTGNPFLEKMLELTNLLNVRYSINSNGASIYDTKHKKFIFKEKINASIANEIYKFSVENKIGLDWWDEENVYANEFILKSTVKQVKDAFAGSTEIIKLNQVKKDVFKMEFLDSKENIDKSQIFLEKFNLQVVRINDFAIEITNNDVSKGTAAIWLLNHLKFNENYAMAIGDSSNDLSMIKRISHTYAMGNATKVVHSEALHSTDDANMDGLGKAIDHFLNKEKYNL